MHLFNSMPALALSLLSLTSAAPLGLPLIIDSICEAFKPAPAVKQLYQFPLGTWIENMAVRQNGNILMTLLNLPDLYELDPTASNATPTLVHSFSGYTGLVGIAEIAPDVFAVTAGNYSLATGAAAAGSWGVWQVDFNAAETGVAKIADVPEATFLNGMSQICRQDGQGKDNLLLGDIKEGVIYFLDSATGQYHVAINNTFTQAVDTPVFVTAGVNGIHVRKEELFLTNTGTKVFARIPIHLSDGTPAAAGTVISHTLNSSAYFDDFTLRGDYGYLVTGSANSVEKVKLDGNSGGHIIAGSLNSTVIAEPTACQMGRTQEDVDVLYVVTAGGLGFPVDGDIRVGAQLVAIDLQDW